MMDELKPCPFCGGEAGVGSGPDGPFVNCTGCLASTNMLVPHNQTETEAIAAWNTRHQPQPSQDDVERVAQRLQDYFEQHFGVCAGKSEWDAAAVDVISALPDTQALRQEVERLRGALQSIEKLPYCSAETELERVRQDSRTTEVARAIARQALKGAEG